MNKRDSYFQFYPDAWLGDEKLALCKFSTKGAWIDLLCHMHKCDPYGYLIINDVVLDKSNIMKMLKLGNERHFDIVWGELLKFGIIKQDKTSGAFYSKRLLNEYTKGVSDTDYGINRVGDCMSILKRFNTVSRSSADIDPQNKFLQNLVHSWLSEYEVDDFYRVTEYLYDKWSGSDTMAEHIIPSVFFGAKFPKYVADSSTFKMKSRKNISSGSLKGVIGYKDLKD
tara:strand:- start:6275 stop:6952 length:678 start_codon:yes stop_codon:yes gene_type:complete